MLIPHTKFEKREKEDFQGRYKNFQDAVNQGNQKNYDFQGFSQDMFSALYQINPKFPEQATSGTSWAKKALDELKGLPEFKQFRESGTKSDPFQSGLGATVLTRYFANSLPRMEKPNPDDVQTDIDHIDAALETLSEALDEVAGPEERAKIDAKMVDLQKAKDNAQEQLQKATEMWEQAADGMDPGQLRQTLRRAIAEAQQEVSEAEEGVLAYGFGSEPGQDGYQDAQTKLAVAERLKDTPKLKEIAELAGRFRREARKQQANKKRPGPDEITDIEIGNDIGRLIPAELALLNDPLTEMDFCKRYLERGLIQYKLEETPHEKKGSIVVCIDSSGSMLDHNRELWSKGIALALCQIAADQRRAFEIITFDSALRRIDKFEAGQFDPIRLLDVMAYFSGGGTDFDKPLTRAFEDIKEDAVKGLKKADVIFITDDLATIQDTTKETIQKAKKDTGASLYTVVLGHKAPVMEEISNEVISIVDFSDKEAENQAKEMMFSI